MLPLVQAKVDKVNRRAVKLNVAGFTLDIGADYMRKVGQSDPLGIVADRFETVVDITINGPVVKLAGWELMGRVDFEDGMVIVSSRPGIELPVVYRSTNCNCEHCNINRNRLAVFVFRHESGEYKQVGRTCLKDFLGTDPDVVLWASSGYGNIVDDIDAELSGSTSRSDSVSLMSVMVASAYTVRLNGFVSRQRANEANVCATADTVSYLLFSNDPKKEYTPTDADYTKAKVVIEWVQSEWSTLGDSATEYQYNAVELTQRDIIGIRRIGIVASLVAAYDRAMIKVAETKNQVNGHVGTVGKRDTFNTQYLGENWFDTAYGRMVIARFATEQGILVYKGNAPFWSDMVAPGALVAGGALTIMGTIKEHGDYKGTKQSIIQRCKVVA
jgi:hypothetical protein